VSIDVCHKLIKEKSRT